PLLASMDDLRLRPHIAETLASIGHPAARAPLAERWAAERHKDTRAALAAALVKLDAKSELAAPLIRFLGTPDPLPDGLDMARRSGLLPLIGTTEDDLARLREAGDAPASIKFKLLPPKGGGASAAHVPGGYRLLARGASTDGKPGRLTFTACPTSGRPDDREPAAALEFPDGSAREPFFSLPPRLAPAERDHCIAVARTANLTVEGIAIVPLADELPPPPPEPWEALPAASSAAALPASGAAPH